MTLLSFFGLTNSQDMMNLGFEPGLATAGTLSNRPSFTQQPPPTGGLSLNPAQGPVTANLTPQGSGNPASTILGAFLFLISGSTQYSNDYNEHRTNAKGPFEFVIEVSDATGRVPRSLPSPLDAA